MTQPETDKVFTPIRRQTPTNDQCPRCPTDRRGWLIQKTLTHALASVLWLECNSPKCDYVQVLASRTPDSVHYAQIKRRYQLTLRWLLVTAFTTLFTGYWLIVSLLYRFR